MNLKLTRTLFEPYGIFGELAFTDASPLRYCYTLEHAFQVGDQWMPVIPEGIYNCVRGWHQLSNAEPFETFEITGVEGHKGLLFHAGNFNADSHGCVLLGREIIDSAAGGKMIGNSKVTFENFMRRLADVDEFTLVVEEKDGSVDTDQSQPA